ncbi:hypothetical protein B0H13DRAFT_1112593 [Mycena leptocephala]|nr:hypothetical protein B0H13DRAFT_1112593 [Mycena leptocephala]
MYWLRLCWMRERPKTFPNILLLLSLGVPLTFKVTRQCKSLPVTSLPAIAFSRTNFYQTSALADNDKQNPWIQCLNTSVGHREASLQEPTGKKPSRSRYRTIALD